MGNITITPLEDYDLSYPLTINIIVNKPLSAYSKLLTSCKDKVLTIKGKLNEIRKGYNKFI